MKKITIFTLFVSLMLSGSPQAYEFGGVTIHGFVSQGYLKSDDNNYVADTEDGTTEFNEIGVNFSAPMAEKLSVGMQFFSRDMGDFGNNDLIVDWAFIDYSWEKWLGFRIGKIKVPYGFYNETRDIDASRTFILLPTSIYAEMSRESYSSLNGASIYGDIPLSMLGTLNYQFQFGRIDIDNDSGIAYRLSTAGFSTINEVDVDDVYVSSLIWETPLEGLRVGWSNMLLEIDVDAGINMVYGYYINTATPMWVVPIGPGVWAPFPIGVDPPDYYIHTFVDMDVEVDLEMLYRVSDLDVDIFSVEYIYDDLIIAFEYMTEKLETVILDKDTMDLYENPLTGEPLLPSNELETKSYYISASYRFCDWFELGAYYSVAYYNKDDKDGELIDPLSGVAKGARAWLKDDCVTARFDINENWALKLEHHSMDGLFYIQPDNDGNIDKNWHLYAAKLTLRF